MKIPGQGEHVLFASSLMYTLQHFAMTAMHHYQGDQLLWMPLSSRFSWLKATCTTIANRCPSDATNANVFGTDIKHDAEECSTICFALEVSVAGYIHSACNVLLRWTKCYFYKIENYG